MRPGPRPALAALAVAGLVLANLGWWDVAWRGSSGSGTVELTGTQGTTGLAQGLLLAIAGALLLTLVVGSAGRRVVGALAGLLFAAVAVLGLARPAPPEAIVASDLTGMLADDWSAVATWVPWAYAATGAAGVAASGWLVARPGIRHRPVTPRGAELADSVASWKAMDEGHDPTEDEGERG